MITPNSKYMKTDSYSCPKKDCPYVWVPGMFVGQSPVGVVSSQGRMCVGCPTHRVGLVKNSERQRIEPYKGTPRMLKVRIKR